MASNLMAGIWSILATDYLSTAQIDPDLARSNTKGPIPVPSFVYYDRFGLIGIAKSFYSFLGSMIGLLGFVLAGAVYYFTFPFSGLSLNSLLVLTISPSMRSYGAIWLSFIMSLLVNTVFSAVKHFLNPGATYGLPELAFVSTMVLTLISFAITQILLQHFHDPSRLFHHSPNGDTSSYAPLLETDNERGEISPLSTRSSTDSESPVSVSSGIQPRPKIVQEWFYVGSLLFWSTWVIFAIIAHLLGYGILYFTVDFAFFSAASFMLTIIAHYYYQKIRDSSPTIFMYLYLYEEYGFFAQMIISTLIPFLFTADIVQQLMIGVPAIIGEGLSGVFVDLLFAFFATINLINLIPILTLTDKVKSIFILSFIFGLLWIPQFLFPYTADRPFKYDFRETWDISNSTAAKKTRINLSVMHGMSIGDWIARLNLPDEVLSTTNFSSLVTSGRTLEYYTDKRNYTNNAEDLIKLSLISSNSTTYTGVVVGSPNSRSCGLDFPSDIKSKSLIDSKEWLPYGSESEDDFVYIFRKSFQTADSRIQVPFTILRSHQMPLNLTVICFHPLIGNSLIYDQFLRFKPSWTLNGIGFNDGGGFRIKKTFNLE